MAIVLLISGVSYATVCVWLGVRIFNRRERWAKWTLTVALVVFFVVYPLSAGPFVWLYDRGYISDDVADSIWYAYLPIIANQSDWSRRLVEWYLSFWLARGERGLKSRHGSEPVFSLQLYHYLRNSRLTLCV